MRLNPSVLGTCLLLTVSCGMRTESGARLKEHWNAANDPIQLLSGNYVVTLSSLPTEGELDWKPWADSYWPSKQGGLAYRWREAAEGHSYQPIKPLEAESLGVSHLARLSPAEKFDIFVGDSSMPLYTNEAERTSPNDKTWFGICHGWAPASLAWMEPKAIVVKSDAGVDVPFAASDIKALLSLHAADYSHAEERILASRCNISLAAHPEAANRSECRDTNAGAFHIVLANMVGIQKQGFVSDVTRDLEVWNQPVSGYKTRVLNEITGHSAGAAPGTTKEVTVETEMFYGAELSPMWAAAGPNMKSKVYSYRLELNQRGQIIGGTWLTEDRPDFLWDMAKPELVDSAASYSKRVIKWSYLKKIYEASLASPEEAAEPSNEPSN